MVITNIRAENAINYVIEKILDDVFKHRIIQLETLPEEEFPLRRKLAARSNLLILSECLDKLTILYLITCETIDPQWLKSPTYQPIEEMMTQKEEKYELAPLTQKRKFVREVTFLTTLINDAMEDVLNGTGTKTLVKDLEIYINTIHDRKALFQDKYRSNVLLKKLSNDMRKIVGKNKEILNNRADKAYKMQENYEEQHSYGLIQCNYVNAWEDSRIFLNSFVNKQAEGKHLEIIQTYRLKKENEQRIHREIASYMHVTVEAMQKDIEEWMKKYEAHVDMYERDMLDLKIRMEKVNTQTAELTKTYQERREEMEEWIARKEAIMELAKQENKKLEAIIKIQAWWRGVMVRKKLGPYGKKKGKKGKDKNKKGKKQKAKGKKQ